MYKYLHLHALCGSSINIYLKEVLFPFHSEPRAWTSWSALHEWSMERLIQDILDTLALFMIQNFLQLSNANFSQTGQEIKWKTVLCLSFFLQSCWHSYCGSSSAQFPSEHDTNLPCTRPPCAQHPTFNTAHSLKHVTMHVLKIFYTHTEVKLSLCYVSAPTFHHSTQKHTHTLGVTSD